MKRWSILIAKIAGTEVRIHATFLLLLAFVAWKASTIGGLQAAQEAVLFVVAMFSCVLLHEFGHVLMAKRYGIKTPDVTLLPIGGLARLERMPREPFQELMVALAGPAVNVVIAGVILVFLGQMPALTLDLDLQGRNFFATLAYWNVIMVFFNMIPAFPMDGGRVLRAVLAMVTGNYAQATRWAAVIGQGFAVLGTVLALFVLNNPFLILIAMFIFLSAGQEAAHVSEQEAVSGLSVREAMMTHFQSLPYDSRLENAVNMLLSGSQHDFPVLDADGEFVGLLTRKRLVSALAEHGIQCSVAEVMESCEVMLKPNQPLVEAMEQLRANERTVLPVSDIFGSKLAGLLTTENIGEILMIRAALGKA